MSVTRIQKRISTSRVAPLIVKIDGDKALKDSDLAALFGIRLSTFYARLGNKLWHFQPRAFHKLSKAHDRGRQDARPTLAFTQAGVMLVAGIFGDDRSLDLGMDIAHALRTRRRVSVGKKSPGRRANDPLRAAHYDEAKQRLIVERLYSLTRKIRH